jgi:hypothetical protein
MDLEVFLQMSRYLFDSEDELFNFLNKPLGKDSC